MKKVVLFFAACILFAGLSFGQAKKTNWKEMTDFQTLMTTAFQPIKTNNFTAVREHAPQLYRDSKSWFATASAERFNKPETMSMLEKLMIRCNDLWAAVSTEQTNEKIKTIVTDIQSMYKKVSVDIKP